MFDIEKVLQEMTLEEKAQMCSGRDFWKTQDIERLGIPSVMMCDGPNGLRKQLGEGDHLGINESIETVCYPTASAFASSFDKDLLQELGKALGEECQAEKVGMLLGPGINMKRSPLCGRNFEYFSEDPYLAGKLAAAYIQGLQKMGIAACVKHFAANNQETRRLSGSSEVDERTLRELYLPAFEMAVKDGKVRSVMCAYNAVNGVYCAENKELLTDILRKEWGFDGFVVTDWGAVKDRVKGLLAGVDLEMPGSTAGKTKHIVEAVKDGSLEESVLDEAVRNVLQFVKTAVENQNSKSEDGSGEFDRAKASEKSGDFEKECAVLLKNEGLLPLSKEKKIAFIGEFAERPRYQGAGSSHINVKHPVSALSCMKDWTTNGAEKCKISYARGYEADADLINEEIMREAVELAEEADCAVIFAGLPESYETEGCDRTSLSLPLNQNVLIHEIAKVQKNIVVVLHGGSAMELPWEEEVSAILCMHLGGNDVGRATVDLLFGKANPSGKLAETWPLHLEDNPSFLNFPGEDGIVEYREGIFIGYRYYDKKKMQVRYPFGHGLSYTNFTYSDLKLSRMEMSNHDTLTVSCKVKNTGSCVGKEAVQLYVGIPGSAVRRPEKELKGFEKVELQPGEEKEVCFLLDKRAFAYYEPKIHDWFVENGAAEISIGASSRDIRLSETVQIHSDMELPMTFTKLTTIGALLKSKKGQEFFKKFMVQTQKSKGVQAEKEENAMGAGSARAHQQMMMEMPLGSLVSYGRMTEEALDALIVSLNEK